MTNAKHTPGPWTVAGDVKGQEAWCPTRHIYASADREARGSGCVATVASSRANARLIAAAPDLLRERDALKVERDALLAALREVKRLRDLWRSQDDDAIDSIDYMDGLDRIDVDSVLARATGGAR